MVDLADIVGQDQALGRLIAAVMSERPPHAWIFAGPAGVGKRTTAWALAKWLLCQDPSGPTPAGGMPAPCGRCPSCRAFDSGAHADFHPVTKELARYSEDPNVRKRVMQNLGIEVVREFVIAPASRAGSLGRGRVFVIEEAELMSEQAQNALLKTLEEPPSKVMLILLCRSPRELLPTTRSRCALVRFGPLGQEFVARRLVESNIEAPEAAYWARQTGGSLGESLRAAQAGLYPVKRELLERLAALRESADAELGEWLAGQAEALAKAAIAADDQLSGMLATRRGGGLLLALLAGIFRDVLSVAAGRPDTLTNADQADAVARLAERFDLDTAADIAAQLGRYEQLLWRNVNAKVLWDNVLITCDTGAALEA
jgi:DNA polymerase III subunit delta'